MHGPMNVKSLLLLVFQIPR